MPAEQPKEMVEATPIIEEPKMESDKPLRRIRTADYGVEVRKIRGKNALFGVRPLENKAVRFIVDLNTETCTCQDFTQQGKCLHIEVVENIGEIRRLKKNEYGKDWREQHPQYNTDYGRKYHQKHRFDPVFKRKKLESAHKRHLKLRQDYEKFKIESGGKCSFCGEGDLEVLGVHHPHGRKNEEKGKPFILTKEFTLWRRRKIKPDVVLVCGSCNVKLNKGEHLKLYKENSQ